MNEGFPEKRVRLAGRTGGEIQWIVATGGDLTTDERSPETLLNDERSHTPDDGNRGSGIRDRPIRR